MSTADAPAAENPEQQVIVPTVADLMANMPPEGKVYAELALERWKVGIIQELHNAETAKQERHVVSLQAALLAAGIDPLTLQTQGAPEVGAPPAGLVVIDGPGVPVLDDPTTAPEPKGAAGGDD